ncbi:ankyrin repeat-containing domain protein [Aspergillus filifer]
MLLDLPVEILLLIADKLGSEADLSSLTRTHPQLYCLFSDILHRNNVRYFGSSALFWAVSHNRLDTIERLLDFGADVNLVDKHNLCLLEIAACDGQTAAAELLLRKGAFFRGSNGQPSPPVCAAATMGNTEVLKVLLDWEETQEHSSTPAQVLHLKYSSNLFRQLFLSHDSESYPLSMRYTVPLFLAIAGAHDTTAECLIQHPKVDLNYRDADQRVPLHWAISHGRDRIITALIAQGADPNIPYPDGRTPLQAALGDRQGRIASLLLGFDSVDPNCRPQNGYPVPLGLALYMGWHDISTIVALLKRPDADLDCELPNNGTVQECVLRMKNPEVLSVFLARRYKGHVGFKNQEINDALFDAAKAGNWRLIDAFLANGTDPTIQDEEGQMPHFYAARAGVKDAFDRFLQTGKVKVDDADGMGWTPLFWACFEYQPEMAKHLLDLGADPNRRDLQGATPLLYIVKAFYSAQIPRPRNPSSPALSGEYVTAVPSRDIVRVLLENGADPFVTDSAGWTIMTHGFKARDELVAGDLMRHARRTGQWDKVEESVEQYHQHWGKLLTLLKQKAIAT